MTLTELEEMVSRALVACLADRVIERLTGRLPPPTQMTGRPALVLVTGTSLGLTEATGALRRLAQAGWSLRSVLTPVASARLSADCRNEIRLIAPSPPEDDPDRLLDGRKALLVPSLTVTTAAKVAAGIRDSLATLLIARALETGVPVIAAEDGCSPDAPERVARGWRGPAAYRDRLGTTLATLRDYGIRLVAAGTLDQAALVPEAPRAAPSAPSGPAGRGTVFGLADARCATGGSIGIGAGVLVTPLAAEELARRSIRVVRT